MSGLPFASGGGWAVDAAIEDLASALRQDVLDGLSDRELGHGDDLLLAVQSLPPDELSGYLRRRADPVELPTGLCAE